MLPFLFLIGYKSLQPYLNIVEIPFMKLKIAVLFLLLNALWACDTNKGPAGKFGSLDPKLPEYAAMEFFDYIYNDQNLDKVIPLSTPSLGRLIASYHTNRNVQRHVLNLRFDKVKISPHPGSAGRNEFAKDTKVIIFFEGELDGNIYKDMRIVDMVRIDDKWIVDQVNEK